MRRFVWFGLAAIAVASVPRHAHAQGIGITPQVGFYVPGDDLDAMRAGLDTVLVKKEGAFALGFNVTLGMLRGSVAYASGATLTQRGVSGEVGDGSVLAIAGDVLVRPLPRFLLQPYVLLGAGMRRENYSYDDDGLSNAFPEDDSDFALHAGLGADITLGPVAISAEITDFISKDENDDWKRHDAFGLVGLKLRL